MKRPSLLFAMPFACVVVLACSKSNPPQAPSGVTNVQPIDASSASDQIANARCKHAQACNDIGEDKSYASIDACMNKNRGELENSLQGSSCQNGIDNSRLDSCVSAINAESCGGVASKVTKLMACRKASLCP